MDTHGEYIALEAEGALAEPLVLGHFFDGDLLGRIGGLVLAEEIVEEGLQSRGIFAGDEFGGAGGEAVREVVEGGLGLARVRFGSRTLFRIRYIGCNLTGCGHNSCS